MPITSKSSSQILYDFIGNGVKAESDGAKVAITHTSMEPPCRYYIDYKNRAKFMELYGAALNDNHKLCLQEIPGEYTPLRVDFDFKQSKEIGKRQYTYDMIEQIVSIYQNIIRESVVPDVFEEKMLVCVLLEKSDLREWSDSTHGVIDKDGFHLHFPHFITDVWTCDEYIRSKAISEIVSEDIFGECSFLEDIDSIHDHHIAAKTWLMYGSAKSKNSEPFLYSKVYGSCNDGGCEEIGLRDAFEDDAHFLNGKIKDNLHTLLSIKGYDDPTELLPSILEEKDLYKPKKRIASRKVRSDVLIYEDIAKIRDMNLIAMLKEERADKWFTWQQVGYALWCITEGAPEGLDFWIEFSKKSVKFVEGECEEKWYKFREGTRMTLGSLIHMAREDAPQEYSKITNNEIYSKIRASLIGKPNETDVSEVLLMLCKDKFICANSKLGIWYHFRDHRWNLTEGIELRRIIVKDLIQKYKDYNSDVAKKIQEEDGGEDKFKGINAACMKVVDKIKTIDFQKKLMKALELGLYEKRGWDNDLNSNGKLFGVENGVLDLENLVFREGLPSDKISFCAGTYYDPTYSYDHPEVKNVLEYLRKVFPIENVRNYFLDVTCVTLEGGNVNKIVVVHTGAQGGNAKSITVRLIEKLFGDYSVKFPQWKFISGMKRSGNDPETARTKGKRFATVQELSKNVTVDISTLKEYSGNDSIIAIDKYQSGADAREQLPQFTLNMPCNEPPKFPATDQATWNRLRFIEYISKFVLLHELAEYPVPSDPKKQFEMRRFKADPNFASKIDSMLPAFLWLLFERYKIYKQNDGLVEPEEVTIATKIHKANNDHYMQFFNEKIEKVEDPEDEEEERVFLSQQDIYCSFQGWCKLQYGETYKDRTSASNLMTELKKHFGKDYVTKPKKGWYGFRIVTDEIIFKKTAEQEVPNKKIQIKKSSNPKHSKEVFNFDDLSETESISSESDSEDSGEGEDIETESISSRSSFSSKTSKSSKESLSKSSSSKKSNYSNSSKKSSSSKKSNYSNSSKKLNSSKKV